MHTNMPILVDLSSTSKKHEKRATKGTKIKRNGSLSFLNVTPVAPVFSMRKGH